MIEAGWQVARQLGRSDCVPTSSSTAIQVPVAPSLGAPVSLQTIQRRLAEGHLGSRCPLRALPLTPTHRSLHLEWCRNRRNWTAAEWTRSPLAMNPDSITVVMTISFVSGDPVMNASILPLLYSGTPPPQLV
ncbi:HTH_Tnp_Tc3_2 domain-containing protein [Trichonephila clavipes]|nr:HTH_Tnp_Tc3_2 domain-containing protein [Trichonephila clavipes]